MGVIIEMASGKIIKKAKVIGTGAQTYNLDNEGFSPGIYAIQLLINAQFVNSIKVVYIQ